MHTRDGRFISQIGIKTLGMIVNILMSDLKKRCIDFMIYIK